LAHQIIGFLFIFTLIVLAALGFFQSWKRGSAEKIAQAPQKLSKVALFHVWAGRTIWLLAVINGIL
jgi:hypothetical protein